MDHDQRGGPSSQQEPCSEHARDLPDPWNTRELPFLPGRHDPATAEARKDMATGEYQAFGAARIVRVGRNARACHLNSNLFCLACPQHGH